MQKEKGIFKRTASFLMAVSMVISTGAFPVIATEVTESESGPQGQISPINQEYVDYLENGGNNENGVVPIMQDLSYLNERYDSLGAKTRAALPASYDLRDYGRVGPVGNQGNYGTCWAFSVMETLQSSIWEQFPMEYLSRRHLAYFSYKGDETEEYLHNNLDVDSIDPYMIGGNYSLACSTLAAWKGPVSDSVLPYSDFTVQEDESMRYMADYHVQDVEPMMSSYYLTDSTKNYENINSIYKQLIIDNGAVGISYYSSTDNTTENSETNAIYHSTYEQPDHDVCIIGWDDNYSKENFAEGNQPENDGAWLLRNSWGTGAGDDGYYWISYEDKTIELGAQFFLEANDNYAKNYQYDTMGWSLSASADDFSSAKYASKKAYMSNIFTAESAEQLEAVSFYTTDVGTKYEISVYTDVDEGEPVSGELAFSGQSGTELYSGYHTIELDQAVALESGKRFSVVVKLENPDYAYPIPVEIYSDEADETHPQYMGHGGESYYSEDGSEWDDITNINISDSDDLTRPFSDIYATNVCLKAFTNPLPSDKTAIGNVDFSLFSGPVAMGKQLELSGADDIYYQITPTGKTAGSVMHYNGYLEITEPCTISAWGEKDGKKGNVVTRTFTQAQSQLTELAARTGDSKSSQFLDISSGSAVLNVNNNNDKIILRPRGAGKITVDGVEVKSDEWSGAIYLEGDKKDVHITTEENGKITGNYVITIMSNYSIDYKKETISYDENKFTLKDAQNKVIKSGNSISDYITVKKDNIEAKKLYLTSINTSETTEITVPQRRGFSGISIDYENERTSSKFANTNYYSYNEDFSDSVRCNADYIYVEPGKKIYVHKLATDTEFASEVLVIDTSEQRPAAPDAQLEDLDADYAEVTEIENAQYRLAPDGEWQDYCFFDTLTPKTDYTIEVRYKATDSSFASLSKKIDFSTPDGMKLYICYVENDNLMWVKESYFSEGTHSYSADMDYLGNGYTIKDGTDDTIVFTVTEDNGEFTCSEGNYIAFEITPSCEPSDYKVNLTYWKTDGTKIGTLEYKLRHTGITSFDELPKVSGYDNVKLKYVQDEYDGIVCSLICNKNGEWTLAGKNIDVIVDRSKNPTLDIIHTNDIHGYYTNTSRGNIGFSYLKSMIDIVHPALVLDAGDTYHGQAFATVEKGMSVAELMKSVGYDAMTVGNHDWSYGAERLKELEAAQGFPILAANVKDENGDDFFDTPYIVKDAVAANGDIIRVGVVGVIDDSFYNSTASDNVSGLTFMEESRVASDIAKTLRDDENCQLVIAMTHNADCEDFVSGLSGVDVVVAGHQHILMDEKYSDADGNEVTVVEAGCYFNDIGLLSITIDADSGEILNTVENGVDIEDFASMTADRDTEDIIKAIEEREKATLSQVIGTSEKAYEYSWEEIRVKEQEIGRIITAAYLDRTGCDVAFENAGGIRGGIPQGDITYGNLISISPYGNTIVTKQMTGAEILELVEYSIELSRSCDEIYSLQKEAVENGEDPMQYSWPSNSGSVLQFGGITVKYDMDKPQGSRIVSAQIGGEDVDPEAEYSVATNNYVAENTDYPAISSKALDKEYGTCEQALKQYIEKNTFAQAAEIANLIDVTGQVIDDSSSSSEVDSSSSSEADSSSSSEIDSSSAADSSTVSSQADSSSKADNSKTDSSKNDSKIVADGSTATPNTGVAATVTCVSLIGLLAAAVTIHSSRRSKDHEE